MANHFSITKLMNFYTDSIKSIKRGENHYLSGDVISCHFEDGIVNGTVKASMKKKIYQATIYLNEKMEITRTECACPRGSYKCSHAAALYIYCKDNISKTDVPCMWSTKKTLETEKTAEELFPKRKRPRALKTQSSIEDLDWFQGKLDKCGKNTPMFWLLSPEPIKNESVLPLIDIFLKQKDFISSKDKAEFLKNRLLLDNEKIRLVADLTAGQKENASWQIVRKGRLTASKFGLVLNAKKVTTPLINKIINENNLDGVQSVMWGINHEPEAIKAFEIKTGLKVKPIGIFLEKNGMLGATPDGLIGDDGIIEVKCPYTKRNSSIAECLTDKKFYLENYDGKVTLKENHNYYHQIQGGLHISRRQTCHFVVWTLSDIFIQIIQRDEDWGRNLGVLNTFYEKYIIPELIG